MNYKGIRSCEIYIILVFYFSPAKDCVSIPGIDDISPEEMRHEALSAKTAGTSAQYQQNLQSLIQGYQNKRQALLNPSQDLKEVLRKIYSKEPLQNIPPNLFQIGQNQGKYITCTTYCMSVSFLLVKVWYLHFKFITMRLM